MFLETTFGDIEGIMKWLDLNLKHHGLSVRTRSINLVGSISQIIDRQQIVKFEIKLEQLLIIFSKNEQWLSDLNSIITNESRLEIKNTYKNQLAGKEGSSNIDLYFIALRMCGLDSVIYLTDNYISISLIKKDQSNL